MINFISVVSSNVNSIGYYQGDLYVKFHTPSTYKYHNVPEHLFNSMLNADSKGEFLNEYIKGRYKYTRVA